MKKRKILSWVLSLALVFSMTSAFVVTVNADQEETNEIQSLEKNLQLDGAYSPSSVTSVEVNGVTLNTGDYIMSNSTEVIHNQTTAPEGSGYAYFNGGHLVLNGFNLTDLTNYAISATSTENDIRTLYIDIIGQNEFTTTTRLEDVKDVIHGNNVNFILSEKEANASLQVTTHKTYCKCITNNGNIIINSGDYTFTTPDGYALYANDAIINGGKLKVFDSYCGIHAMNRTFINGGTIKISNFVFGIYSGKLLSITGGKINITDCRADAGTGLFVSGSIAVDGLNTDINISGVDNGISTDGTFTMNGGYIKVSDVYCGINCEGEGIDFTMKAGTIEVSEADNCGIRFMDMFYGDFTMDGGTIKVSGVGYNGIDSNNLTMNAGTIEISDVANTGLELGEGKFTMDGGTIKVSHAKNNGIHTSCSSYNNTMNGGKILMSDIGAYGMKFDGTYMNNMEVIINNATVDIESTLEAIYTLKPVKINNSNVKAQSTTDAYGHYAIYPSVELTGNHTVYAGSTPDDKKLITSKDSLGTYQYVEIINNQTVSSNFISSIFSNITKLFASTSKSNLGSMLSYLLIGKLLIKIIKIL